MDQNTVDSLEFAKSYFLKLADLDRIRAKYWNYRANKIPDNVMATEAATEPELRQAESI